MKKKEAKLRRSYSDEFKKSAVEMIVLDGKSAPQVARELGIPVWSLREWKQKALAASGCNDQGVSAKDIEADNRELRRELERVKRQRDILKKALGIVSDQ